MNASNAIIPTQAHAYGTYRPAPAWVLPSCMLVMLTCVVTILFI